LSPIGTVTKNQAVAGYSEVTGTKNQQVGFIDGNLSYLNKPLGKGG
jgi:hypothetical protein